MSSSAGTKKALEASPPVSGAAQPLLAAEGLVMDAGVDAADGGGEAPVTDPEGPDHQYGEILRTTQWWVLYGTGGFAVLCILIGAIEALFGR